SAASSHRGGVEDVHRCGAALARRSLRRATGSACRREREQVEQRVGSWSQKPREESCPRRYGPCVSTLVRADKGRVTQRFVSPGKERHPCGLRVAALA